MNSIFLTGSSGFVGINLIEYFDSFIFLKYQRVAPIEINQDVVIHLAGKAHDLKNTSIADEYYQVNTELTKKVFDAFLASDAKVFIALSSVKAVADEVDGALTEGHIPNPITHYGKSKLLAEQYIISKEIPKGKRVYILRPCMIHGPGNKGNLNLIYKLVSKGIPWPLGAFENNRSFCSIDNLLFIMNELIENTEIASGIYNIADDEPIGTNKIIEIVSNSLNRDPRIWRLPQFILNNIAKAGDRLRLPLNTERLKKLTENYIVSNKKIKEAINKSLPVSSKEGLLKTIESFNH
jgi:nucleoside-diphosphate-sugar epimerase